MFEGDGFNGSTDALLKKIFMQLSLLYILSPDGGTANQRVERCLMS